MNPYVKQSVTGILRASGVFKGSGTLGELRSSDEAEVKNGHPSEYLGRQERHWRISTVMSPRASASSGALGKSLRDVP